MPYAKVLGQTTERERLSRKLRDNAYRARKMGCRVEQVTIADAEASGLLAQSQCYYCGVTLDGMYALEHKVSLFFHGAHSLDNITKACMKCNEDKHTANELDYLARLDLAS